MLIKTHIPWSYLGNDIDSMSSKKAHTTAEHVAQCTKNTSTMIWCKMQGFVIYAFTISVSIKNYKT